MTYRVILDRGVDIAGVHYKHDAVIDPAAIVPDVPALLKDATPEAIEEHKKKKAALAKQAPEDLAAIVKAGNQVEEVKAEKIATAATPAEKEG